MSGTLGLTRPVVKGLTPKVADEVEACLDLRACGMSLGDIALALDLRGMKLSKNTVQRRLQLGYSMKVLPSVEEARQVAIDQHERVLAGLAFKIRNGDVAAINAWAKVNDQLAKITGIYAPVQVNVEHTLTSSVDEELQALADRLGINDKLAREAPADTSWMTFEEVGP